MILDEEEILFLAFRYALGRRTYVVGEVVETLSYKWSTLKDHTRYMIIKEIRFAIDFKRAGSKTDIDEWKKILKLTIKEND